MSTEVFDFFDLGTRKTDVEKKLRKDGYIPFVNVPDFENLYQNLLYWEEQFLALPEEEREKCTPHNFYSHGWSFGVETFKGKKDLFKGSYYADIPETKDNVWPTKDVLSGFKQAYLDLGNLIFKTGREVLRTIGVYNGEAQAKCRMLFYGETKKEEDSGNPNWCGEHFDHGMFTGLCPAAYHKDGKWVSKPEGAGLYVEGKPVSVPSNALIFQVGETAQLISNGQIRATRHHVKKGFGVERFTFAVFISPPDEYKIHSTEKGFEDRYESGITVAEWGARSYAKYYQ